MHLFRRFHFAHWFCLILIVCSMASNMDAQVQDSQKGARSDRQIKRLERRSKVFFQNGASVERLGLRKWIKMAITVEKHEVAQPRRFQDPAIVSSKVYADFQKQHGAYGRGLRYGLTVLLHRYQINSIENNPSIRSRSLFLFRPSVSGFGISSVSPRLQWECQSGVQMASNSSILREVEFINSESPLRLWKECQLVGQVVVKWNLTSALRQNRIQL